ncbi:MAG: sulfide/dihydroorotate dehydrogenase-like FAD/NAD-binding protein [Candidatus Muiribacteriota bacterium]
MDLNTIIDKKIYSDGSAYFKIYNPDVASNCFAGNFVILIAREGAERIPLTVVEYEKEWLSILVQPIGFSTKEIVAFEKGESFSGMLGPLGKKMHNENYGTVMFVAGGIGIAPVIPQMMELKKAGNKIILVHGARTSNLIVMEDLAQQYTDEYIICTDDGSRGEKGIVTQSAEKIINSTKINHVVTIGPLIMMKYVALLTKKYDIATTASLNTIMLDGTGMCGSCRVEYDGEVKFACVDGPDMDAHKINFDVLLARNSRFVSQEKEVLI